MGEEEGECVLCMLMIMMMIFCGAREDDAGAVCSQCGVDIARAV